MNKPAPKSVPNPASDPAPDPAPDPDLNQTPNPVADPVPDQTVRPYRWEKRGANCFACIGQAEISRPRRGQPWVVMIPLAMEGNAPGSWGLMLGRAGDGTMQFASAKDAMAEAERYLSIFHQYHRPAQGETLDLAAGTGGVGGGQAIGGRGQ